MSGEIDVSDIKFDLYDSEVEEDKKIASVTGISGVPLFGLTVNIQFRWHCHMMASRTLLHGYCLIVKLIKKVWCCL